jgi:6-pyruvoyl tetrahydropterin synthase-like protein
MDQSVHNHTFEISLYIKQNNESFVLYDVTETIIQDYLRPYSGVILNAVPPFDVISPTVENIGEVFFTEITLILAKIGYQLVTLDISENPQRTFSISEEDLSEKNRDHLHRSIRRLENEVASSSSNSNAIPGPAAAVTHLSPSADEEQHIVPDVSGHASTSPMTIRPASNLSFVLSILLVIAAGFAAMTAVRMSGIYPLGLDIHGHLFKSDLMYHEILKGNLYPLYTEFWYNGVQPFRYWAPLPYYTVAFLQFVNSGDIMNAYLGFIWLSFTVGGFGWVLFGRKLGRPYLGAFFGIVWFMLSDNLRVFFGEGNLPRMFIAMILPYLFYCLWQFVCYRRKKMIFPLILLMLMAILGHLMIAAMVGVATAIFLLLYSVANKRYRESIIAILAMLFAFAVAGIWLYASLVGGLAAMSSDATATVMATQSSPLSQSLNPLLRLEGGIGKLYLGLSIAIISLIGIFLSNRKSLSGFGTMFIIILGTSTALTPLILLLPLSQYFWISRFTPIAYALFVVALFEWRTIKKPILVLMCAAILLDSVPSFMLNQYNRNMNLPATHDVISQTMDDELYTKAKEITRQRISLMDLSIMGPLPSYAFCTLEPKTQYVFGWAWQGAATASNISSLNESLEKENYLYTFDRNIELGADTVLIDKRQLTGDTDQKAIISAAERLGYTLVDESEHILLFSLPVESTFGVLTKYSGLAIGTTAAIVPLILPYYHPGDKLKIDEYSVEELSQYDRIYLSGFFYDDKAKAEQIVRSIAEKGVLVYVDMSRIPADPLTNRMTFLDISAQPITFTGRFPELISSFQTTTAIPFPEGYEKWNTVYLTGLTESDGYSWFEDTKLDYVGTGTTPNITFFGFNLLFHAYTADDAGVKSVFNSIMELEENKLPERTIVPLDITYDTNKITIVSAYNDVNTTLAFQDTFNSEQPIRSMNQFLIVDQGTTVITLEYPYPAQGMAVSAIGIALEAVLIYIIYHKPKQIVSRKSKK